MPYTTITATSNGYTGSPGWHRMKFIGALTGAECTTVAAAMKTFYQALITFHPSVMSMSWQQPAQVYSDAGVLTNEVQIPTLPTTLAMTGTGVYAGGTGAVVFWNTGAINGGHKVRGRTYLVPLVGTAFNASGTPSSTTQAAINAAAATLISTVPGLAVNSRDLGQVDRGNQTVVVTSATVPSRAATLRSRRG